MDKVGIRHLYSCPSCHAETWHLISVVGPERFGLTCIACNLTSLLTQRQLSTYQQNWEAELDDSLQEWEESWQTPPDDD